MLPGQELAVHTDVPEFRGADRRRYPQWLMVVMLHSGLFERWRMPIATGISYFGDAVGGALSFWPGPAPTAPSDSLSTPQHGRRHRHRPGVPRRRPGRRRRRSGPAGLRRHGLVTGRRRWLDAARRRLRPARSYVPGRVRFSVSWKAYCFADEDERRLGATHRRPDARPDPRHARRGPRDLRHDRGPARQRSALARALVDGYIRFPAAAAGR